ncbi:tyrosine-type recombinase/integrase [Nubsella zeaxanthinifaciens]|uniref:tyrosine-type recombinase/integrase n=1 Tax=Nubsella zeaxanthinifaciens TaxID=392412 RepID=UPI003D04A500
MSSIKLVVWSRENKDGQFPIAVKISKKGHTPSYIFTDHVLSSRDLWDNTTQRVKKEHPNHKRLNSLLLQKLAEATETSLQMEINKTDTSARAIKRKIDPKKAEHFNDIAQQYLKEELAQGHYNVYNADKPRIERFIEFTTNKNIPFAEITVGLLEKFQRYLRGCKNKNQKKTSVPSTLSERTVVNHLLLMRTLYNRAIKSGAAETKDYPFGEDGKIQIKLPKSVKVGLVSSEIEKIENSDLKLCETLNHAKNIWLTAYYFAGMRITDVFLLKWSDFQNGRLNYCMSKNNKPLSFPIPQKFYKILGQYKQQEQKHDLIFPELKCLESLDNLFNLQKRISHAVNWQNKKMERVFQKLEINKKASSHVSRHSFAQRAAELDIHPRTVQELYGHESLTTTMIYQSNFSYKKVDEALNAVLGICG